MPQYVDTSELLTWLRAAGVPTEVTDAQLGYHITSALSRYSRLRPMYMSYGLSVVSSTQEYELPSSYTQTGLDDALKPIRVIECLYNPSGAWSMPSLFTFRFSWWRIEAGEYYVWDQPSLGYLWEIKSKHVQEFFKGTWEEYEKADGKSYLRLSPTPISDYTLPLLIQVLRPQERIREDDRHIFSLCVLIEACQYLSTGMGPATSFSDTGLTVDYGAGVQHYNDLAKKYENQLIALAGNFSTGRKFG